MPVLFAAGELESFNSAFGVNVTMDSATTAAFDGDYARAAITCTADGFVSALFAAQTEGWFHCEIYSPNVPDSNVDVNVIELRDSTTDVAVCTIDGNNGEFGMNYNTGSGSFTRVVFSTLNVAATLHSIDIHWKIADSLGEFTVLLDGAEVATFAGDTLQTGFTTIDELRLLGGDDIASTSSIQHFSQIIVADESTASWKLATLDALTGGSTNTAWTGTFTDVEDILPDDLTFIDSDTATEEESFPASDLSVAAALLDVEAVVIGIRGKRGDTGPQNIQAMVRTGAANFQGASLSGLSTAHEHYQTIWSQNPDTVADWTASEVDALEIGVKSIT